MTSHELAAKLLAGPDVPVVTDGDVDNAIVCPWVEVDLILGPAKRRYRTPDGRVLIAETLLLV